LAIASLSKAEATGTKKLWPTKRHLAPSSKTGGHESSAYAAVAMGSASLVTGGSGVWAQAVDQADEAQVKIIKHRRSICYLLRW
jgi:hypothetical protein